MRNYYWNMIINDCDTAIRELVVRNNPLMSGLILGAIYAKVNNFTVSESIRLEMQKYISDTMDYARDYIKNC